MKYYDSSFEEYVQAVKTHNMHPELKSKMDSFSPDIQNFRHVLLYGPSGAGKYSQALSLIQKYSPSHLKYDKKVSIYNEKTEKRKFDTGNSNNGKKKSANSVMKKSDFVCRISDIHYEVDMSLLGCNSKTLWHDIFFQIVDIVSVKPQKYGIILCKNMHHIYNELLDVFYSYINHPLYHYNIHIFFVLLTESVGFLPQSILNSFDVIRVKRPDAAHYIRMAHKQPRNIFGTRHIYFLNNIEEKCLQQNIDAFGPSALSNLKEVHMLKRGGEKDIPRDIFNTVVDEIITKMMRADSRTFKIQDFRNDLYNMLIYNLDVSECICHILFYTIENGYIRSSDIQDVLYETYTFFKYYNNNYRPIYHLESMIFFIMNKIHGQRELNWIGCV